MRLCTIMSICNIKIVCLTAAFPHKSRFYIFSYYINSKPVTAEKLPWPVSLNILSTAVFIKAV